MEVTKKNPKRVEGGKKAYEARLLKLKEQILSNTSNIPSNVHINASNVPTNASNAASNVPSNTSNAATTKSTDVYMYGVRSLAILVVKLCVFYTFKGKKKVQQAVQQRRKTCPTF